MIPPIEPQTLSPVAQKLLDPGAPAPLRALGAKGVAPGLKPAEALTVCVLLSLGADALAETALATLPKFPPPILNGALAAPDLHPAVLDVIGPLYAENAAISERVLNHPRVSTDTVAEIAMRASEAVSELVATNEQRLLANPTIIEKLYMNRATRMSTSDRLLDLAVRNQIELSIPAFAQAAAAIANELIPEATEERTFDDDVFQKCEALAVIDTRVAPEEDTHEIDDETGKEVLKAKYAERQAAFGDLNASGKIRRAILGDSKDRMLGVRDSNPLVREAAAKAPGLSENEVARITSNRNTNEDVLRILATDRDWTRSYQVKMNLVGNPRTPFAFSSRIVPLLRENDLRSLAKSREIPGAVQNAVKQHLSKRKTR